MTESSRRNLFLALCALVLLHTGAHISQSYVNYPTWHLIEAESFKPYHWAITLRAGVFLATPRLLEIVLALIVLRFRPVTIERWTILTGIGLAVGALLSTILLSRPIHAQLDIQSNTPELLARLMATDWVRNVLEWLRAALYLWALSRLTRFNARLPSPDARYLSYFRGGDVLWPSLVRCSLAQDDDLDIGVYVGDPLIESEMSTARWSRSMLLCA